LLPLVRSGTSEAALGRDDESIGVRIERLRDQLLADMGPVRFRGIDQCHIELDRAPQRRNRLGPVGRRSPDPFPGDAHRAQAKAMNREVSANKYGAAKRGRGHGHGTKWQSNPLLSHFDGEKGWLSICSRLSRHVW